MTNFPKSLFLSHGAGPMPLIGDAAHAEMVTHLQHIALGLPRPAALVVVSAHWEKSRPTLTAAAQPELIYDYDGFPPETYDIAYPCQGDPRLAEKVYELLTQAGIETSLDPNRGFDHGVFVPLKIMYPKANIPCVQLSLVDSLDPAEHIRIGQALVSLHADKVLVIGSGFSFHNLSAFSAPQTIQSRELNHAFEQWLIDTCANHQLSEQERNRRLTHWTDAPGARYCHPREEHLLPLHVCYGVAQSASNEAYELGIMNKESSMYLWQAPTGATHE